MLGEGKFVVPGVIIATAGRMRRRCRERACVNARKYALDSPV
jgi:hypothetical protein